jgi:hypothetical protein
MINLCLSTWVSNKVALVSDSSWLPLWPYLWFFSIVLLAIMLCQCPGGGGSLKTSRPPCFRPTSKNVLRSSCSTYHLKLNNLVWKLWYQYQYPWPSERTMSICSCFEFWNIEIFIDTNCFSYYPREIVFELSCFLFIFQNVHQGYPTETLVRFLKAREWHVNKAHRMVIVNTAIFFFNFHIDEPLSKSLITREIFFC